MKAPGRFARTTLGRLRGLRIFTLVTIVVGGLVVGGVLYSASATAGAVGAGSGPAVAAVQEARASLAEANRAVVASFRSGTARLAGPGQRYQDGITRANRAFAQLSEHYAGDVEATQQLQFVNAMVVTYMGLVGQADTAHRLAGATDAGYDLGRIYLWQASKLLYDPADGILTLLDALGAPAVEDLDRSASDWSLRPAAVVVVLLAAVLLLGVLLAAQLFLLRRFQRVVNPALALATLLLIVVSAWAGVATVDTNRDYAAALDAHADVVGDWRERAQAATSEAAIGLSELLAAPCRDDGCQARVAGALAASLPAEEPPVASRPVPEQPVDEAELAAFHTGIDDAADPAGLRIGMPALVVAIAVLALLGFKPRIDEFRA